MTEKNINTLLELLQEYYVEIPKIQRDYAQGRTEQHSSMVRNTLLSDIKSALLKQSPQLDLNFVYGKIQGNKFMPVDGQQRLTTLFLLHIYAFKNDTSKTSLLSKFSYETRISSRDFIAALVEHRQQIFSASLSPSEEILDSAWFVSSWRFDPTIQSMLVMLDAIKTTFADVDNLDVLLSDLNNKPLVFQFLKMEELGMEDTLYIKLNARGKPLTEFENFKARLFGRLHELTLPFAGEFERTFDGKWTDLFWDQFQNAFDKKYLNFFGVIFMNNGLIETDSYWANTFDFSKIDASIFETVNYCLNFLCDNKSNSILIELFRSAVDDRRTYSSRLIFHALTTYLYASKGTSASLKMWLRIMQNLIKNSSLDESKSYRLAAKSIIEMSKHWQDLLAYFNGGVTISGFSTEQVQEEQIKAKIIKSDTAFADAIYEAEAHPYFFGQIRSALYLAKDACGKYDIGVFKCYWWKIAALFEGTKPKNGLLLRRALLSKGDYTLAISNFKTLCIDDAYERFSTPSLKRLFSMCCREVQLLLDDLNINNDLDTQLQAIIDASAVSQNDWRYCFIHYPALFSLMSPHHLRIRNINSDYIILPGKGSNGYNYSIYLEALKQELSVAGIAFQELNGIGTTGYRCLYIKNFSVEYSWDAYIIYDVVGNKIEQTNSNDVITEVLCIIKKLLA